jgi:pyruvate dehydrogenase E1 component alpha subunit
VTTPAARACAVKDIAARAQAYEMPGVAVDGQDPIAVYEAVSQAVARARSGGGPSLIEAKTYRYREHAEGFGGDVLYRTDDEVASWRKRDPVTTFRAQLIDQGVMSASDVERLEASVRQEVADGLEFARQSPYPAPEEAFDGLYATPLQAASATV